jgi:protein tyrosine phosphatase
MNIPSRVVELRMQRPYLVTTAIQYEAIYDAVKRCIEREETSKGDSKNNS